MIKDDMKEKILRERLVSKKTVSELVDEYGVSAGSISRWTRDYLASHNKGDISELGKDKSNELNQLRKQNMEQMEEIRKLNYEKSLLENLLMQLYERDRSAVPAKTNPSMPPMVGIINHFGESEESDLEEYGGTAEA